MQMLSKFSKCHCAPAVLGMRHIFDDASRVAASCCFIDASRVTPVLFLHFSLRHRHFASPVINFTALKTCFNADTPSHWQPNSPLSAQGSSSTHPASGQTLPTLPSGHPHPSPPSGHLPPILLAVKLSPFCPVVILTPPHPAVIFHPSC